MLRKWIASCANCCDENGLFVRNTAPRQPRGIFFNCGSYRNSLCSSSREKTLVNFRKFAGISQFLSVSGPSGLPLALFVLRVDHGNNKRRSNASKDSMRCSSKCVSLDVSWKGIWESIMWFTSEPVVFLVSIAVFLAGLVSVVMIRVGNNGQCHHRWHCLFYVALVALGILTMLAAGTDNSAWLTSGAGLSVMTVGITLDSDGAAHCDTSF